MLPPEGFLGDERRAAFGARLSRGCGGVVVTLLHQHLFQNIGLVNGATCPSGDSGAPPPPPRSVETLSNSALRGGGEQRTDGWVSAVGYVTRILTTARGGVP